MEGCEASRGHGTFMWVNSPFGAGREEFGGAHEIGEEVENFWKKSLICSEG